MKSRIIQTLLLALLIAMIAGATLTGANSDKPNVNAQPSPWIKFHDEINLTSSLRVQGSSASAPLALASGDFDEDGTDDLAAGYSTAQGGEIIIYRGDQEAISKDWQAAALWPFQAETLSLNLIQPPDFIATGDFDADGNVDLVAAARATNALHLFLGNGKGGFASPESIDLPGSLRAMAAGEVNRRDGLKDLIVTITSPDGAKALVYESPSGALRDNPEILSLPAEAGSIALAHLDNDHNADIALSAGSGVVIIHGRDRKLTLAEYARTSVKPARMDRLDAGASIRSLVTGDFTGDIRDEIAMVTDQGAVRFLKRTDTRRENQDNEDASWNLSISTLSLPPTARTLIAAKVSSLAKTDLLIADPQDRKLHMLIQDPQAANRLASHDVASEVIAVLPMRLNQDALNDLVMLNSNSLSPSLLVTAPTATFFVNSAADTDDGACNADCTLREAINAANATPGADAIQFAIGAGNPTINVGGSGLGSLPVITDAVTINGNTGGATRVELNGTAASSSGLNVQASNAVIRGLVINRFPHHGISIGGNNNTVANCLIGTDSGGTLDMGNAFHGVDIETGASNNRIGGTTPADKTVISGNEEWGISVGSFSTTATTGNIISRTFVGLNITGDAAIANGEGGIHLERSANANTVGVSPGGFNVISGNLGSGIVLSTGSPSNLIQFNLIGTNLVGDQRVPNFEDGIACFGTDNTIGGPAATAINLISGNTRNGIFLRNGTGNRIQGCQIGTNADGDAELFNAGNGIYIEPFAQENEIGGITSQLRNIISGNRGAGVRFFERDTENNRVFGNYIGTDITGELAVPNSNNGVFIESGPIDNIIGGLTAAERNIISGNFQSGVRLFNAISNEVVRNNKVIGNHIGISASGAALGNSLHGVFISENTVSRLFNNFIGGTESGAGNVIAHNGGDGIHLVSGNRILISSNSIHSNESLGIDLSPSGVTANNDDTAASELARPNRGRNFPVLTSAITSGSSIVINGTLDSLPSTPFLIELFDNDAIDAAVGGDNSHGEGKTYIGSTVVTTNASGDATFSVTLAVNVAAGHFITATSTNDLNTSEFSRAAVVCGYALSSAPESQFFSSRGGNGKVGITTQGVCGWTAVSNVAWIVITSATSGTGNESITFEVRENFTASARTGTLTIAGQTFTVMQDKPGTTACAYTVSPLSQTVAAAGGTATASVTTAAGCAWNAKADVSWITITSASAGTGNGSVTYSVAANTGPSGRNGTITIAGKKINVKQPRP
ncbi:MAG TPA: BACON domain-containing carbohydrate-binding protein [Blastocatellia bacterium]|nr:BACON domain-containing carbohydrate-binding protein [Blastocatellia bacterium]